MDEALRSKITAVALQQGVRQKTGAALRITHQKARALNGLIHEGQRRHQVRLPPRGSPHLSMIE